MSFDSRFDWIDDRLARRANESLLRQLRPIVSISGTMRVRISSPQHNASFVECVNFGSNDYLGLAAQQTTSQLDHVDATVEENIGSGASPLVTGFSATHQELQTEIARLEGTDAAVLFPTGFAANLGVISALAEPGDVILSDAANHASIIDGCRLSKAQRYIYPHLDLSAVRALLDAQRSKFNRAFIVTDSVFSMDGDFAPLDQLTDLAERYDAIMIVDEAHATGVYGSSGSGLCEHFDVKHRVPLRVGTLSKAVGSLGGFVAGPQNVIDYLINTSRPLIYSTAMPPIVARLALENLKIIRQQPDRRRRLFELCDHFRSELEPKWNVPDEGHIFPLVVGQSDRALAFAEALINEGLLVPAIRPPTVAEGKARLRVSLSALHEEDAIDRLIKALSRLAI